MNDISVDTNTGEITSYKPTESLQTMAVAEVAEKHYRRAKDTEGLHRAIEAIWTERNNFVVWWDAQKTHGGDRKSEEYQDDRPVNLKLESFNLSSKVVSRWRQKLGDGPEKIIEAQFLKAVKIIDPAALADKHTGDEESYTPSQYIIAAREVMGAITLDPASNDMAQKTVNADTYYTEDQDGLAHDWSGKVWMNPPYTARVINQFIEKLVSHYVDGDVTDAIVLTNNNTDTSWFHLGARHAAAVCFTAGRINFQKRDGSVSSPTNGQAFLYFGDDAGKFADVFSQFGMVMEKCNVVT